MLFNHFIDRKMKNNHNSKNQDEQMLEIEVQECHQLRQEFEQWKQEQKPCFSLTSLALVALGVSFFD